MINKLRLHHGFQIQEYTPAKNANRRSGEKHNTDFRRVPRNYLKC